jgi:hypothetical protein
MLDKNLLKAYLKAFALYFWPFQRPFRAVFRHSGFLGWELGFLCTFFLACLKFKKRVILRGLFIRKGVFRRTGVSGHAIATVLT